MLQVLYYRIKVYGRSKYVKLNRRLLWWCNLHLHPWYIELDFVRGSRFGRWIYHQPNTCDFLELGESFLVKLLSSIDDNIQHYGEETNVRVFVNYEKPQTSLQIPVNGFIIRGSCWSRVPSTRIPPLAPVVRRLNKPGKRLFVLLKSGRKMMSRSEISDANAW